jgi:hypothetical protein
MDQTQAISPRKLELAAADARGPFALGHVSSILAGRQGGGVRLGRRDSQALGHRHGSAATDAQA